MVKLAKRGLKTSIGITYTPKISRGVFIGARISCADNSGAKQVKVIGVMRMKGRLRRRLSAAVGDRAVISVSKGTPEMRRQIFHAIIVRQKKPYRRPDGTWVLFEDNAAILTTPEGDLKGSEIHGPVAREAAERWPKLAGLATIVI